MTRRARPALRQLSRYKPRVLIDFEPINVMVSVEVLPCGPKRIRSRSMSWYILRLSLLMITIESIYRSMAPRSLRLDLDNSHCWTFSNDLMQFIRIATLIIRHTYFVSYRSLLCV